MKVDFIAPARVAIGIVALIATYGTPLFWLVLYLILAHEIEVWAKFRL